MSISSEITRITNKRDASLAVVASKGVTVPSGSTMDDLPGLIDLIVVDPTYSVSKTLTNVTSSNDDSKVIAGGSFYADLTPTSGYAITNITVTMGGVDITDQVFKPGLGAKAITANGSYSASADSLGGFSAVSVNVPNSYTASDEGKVVSSGALVSQTSATYTSNNTYDTTTVNSVTVYVSGGGTPTLQSKTKTYTPTTSTQTETVSADTGYDGLSSVGITVDPIPSQYIVPSGTKSITANGTGIDIAAYASVDVAVPVTGKKYATGTYTPDADKNTTANVKITDVATMGFTPSKFMFTVKDRADVSNVQYAIIYEFADWTAPIKLATRYSNASNTLSTSTSGAAVTTQTNYYLYFNSDTVYIRTTSSFILKKDVEYVWYAYE